MTMDPRLGFSVSTNGFPFDDESVVCQNLGNSLEHEDTSLYRLMDHPFIPPHQNPSNSLTSMSNVRTVENSPEDLNFSDVVLNYISQMLMEEDMEEKTRTFQETLALQAAEKPFYEILGQKYPPSPSQPSLHVDHKAASTGDSSSICGLGKYESFLTRTLPADYTSQSPPQSSSSSSISVTSVIDGLVQPQVSRVQVPDLFNEKEPVWQLRRGVEEASMLLPKYNNLTLDLENHAILHGEEKEEATGLVGKVETKEDKEYSFAGSRGRKNLHREALDLEEGRSNKLSAVYSEETLRSDMFDMVLLGSTEEDEYPLFTRHEHEALKNRAGKVGQSKGSNGGKNRGKKHGGKGEVVDLMALLIGCAHAVAAVDLRSANELLKQIKQHSSPFGDGNQRMAHYFAAGLQARLAGTAGQIYKGLTGMCSSASDILKAYHLFLSVCPFMKISNFFSNQTIMNLAKNATRLHIIDFGIHCGFQWPCLIQALSRRPGGPPKLRITGIEVPQPGFRPASTVEETGRRLANYANSFNVPFEYNAIALRWETIGIEDLKLDSDEVLVVNCLNRLRQLLDETVIVDSPRDAVLNLIRRINPDVFILGILNGAYSAPYFVTRFREALFTFTSVFDMLDSTIPHELEERILIEREIIGQEILNVIACEGSERVNRAETYKKWLVRMLKAGFKQLPLNKDIVKKAKDRVRLSYHKDFVVDVDSHWLLQGWKGRILDGLSSWKSQ